MLSTEMLSNQSLEKYFHGYSFGTIDYSKIVLGGLVKALNGFYNCHSINTILLELGYITYKSKSNGEKKLSVTKTGKMAIFKLTGEGNY
jgi:hypothetical protein